MLADKLRAKFESRVKVSGPNDCWLWIGNKNQFGYGRFKVNGKREVASRIAYQLYVGPIPDGLLVLHRCDNPSCMNPAHLFVGTNDENMEDARVKGRMNRGEKNNRAKLTEKQVREIRRRHAAGESPIALAKGVWREKVRHTQNLS